MSATGTAIFLEPQGTLLAALRERKAWLQHAMPGQPFSTHPPHCTLLFGRFGPPAAWRDQLGAALAALPAFELETDGWQQFPRDALAGGGHTVAFRVHKTAALLHLQQAAADCLASFVDPRDRTDHPLAGTEPFASSLLRYGFPFVGSHWIPHFTVGSPQVTPGDPLLAALLVGPVRHRFLVDRVSVWAVEGDRHLRLHELALGPSQI